MRRLAGPMGNRISPPQMHLLPDDRTESYVRACKNVISSNVQVGFFHNKFVMTSLLFDNILIQSNFSLEYKFFQFLV